MNQGTDDTPLDTTPAAIPDPPRPRAPGAWAGIGAVALYFALQFVVSTIVVVVGGVVLTVAYSMGAGRHNVLLDKGGLQHLLHQPDVRIATIIVSLVLTASLMLWCIRHFWRAWWPVALPPGLGFSWPTTRWYFLGAVVVGLVAAPLGGLLAHALAGPHAPKQDISVWAHSVSMGWRIPFALATVCIVPIVEEAIFRGVLLAGLMRRMHVVWAVLLSAAIFGAVHVPDFRGAWYPVPSLFLLGVVLAWLRLRSRSLWTSITTHATFNAVGVIGWFLAVHPHP